MLINAALALVIEDAVPEVVYQGNHQRALGRGDVEKLAQNYFKKRLIIDLSKEVDVSGAFLPSAKHRYLAVKEAVTYDHKTVTIEIPAAGTNFQFDSTKADLVLILSKIRIGTQTADYYENRVKHGINTTGQHLIYTANFVLWDNRTNQYICYGRVKSLVPVRREEAVIAEWEELSQQFVRTIFEPTGFLKKKK
ncbi:MAG: hypothetical protein LBI42_10030 [Chitinispirillales bacterium]|nr:hypothetical protein [Chitinispirillales bacterium]